MLQCESSAMGAAAALRLRLLYRLLRAGELLALVAFVSWSTSYVPSAVAAVLRLAGSLLLNARFVFVLGNAIVILLFALSRHDITPPASNEEPAASSTGTAAANPPAPSQQASPSSLPAAGAAASFASSFVTTPVVVTTTLPPSSMCMGGAGAAAAAASFDPPPPATDDHPAREPDPALLFEDRQPPPAPARVNNNIKARAPRRSRSEKMRHRAASPELRRCESENGRTGRRRSSVTARDAEACSWGREDADEFRRQVEAFIARQTRFHREESIKTMAVAAGHHCDPAPAFTGALAVVE